MAPTSKGRLKTSGNKGKVTKTKKMGGVSATERILLAVASRHSMGESKPLRDIVRGLATMTNKRSFDTTILNLKKKNRLVDYDRVSIWLTDEGKDRIGHDQLIVPQTNDEMQDKIRTEMIKGAKPRQIYDLMLDGRWHSRAELAKEMDLPNNKSFGTYISSLSKIVERNNGKIRLLDMVFPLGRPSE